LHGNDPEEGLPLGYDCGPRSLFVLLQGYHRGYPYSGGGQDVAPMGSHAL